MNPPISREQLEHEARAKIFWGDEAEAVVKFLRMNGIPAEEAEATVYAIVDERMSALRSSGIRKIILGVGLACVPVVAYFIFLGVGFMPYKIIGIAGAVGLWGLWKIFKGTMMLLFPESETIDLADDTD